MDKEILRIVAVFSALSLMSGNAFGFSAFQPVQAEEPSEQNSEPSPAPSSAPSETLEVIAMNSPAATEEAEETEVPGETAVNSPAATDEAEETEVPGETAVNTPSSTEKTETQIETVSPEIAESSVKADLSSKTSAEEPQLLVPSASAESEKTETYSSTEVQVTAAETAEKYTAVSSAMYRMYNPNSGEHFYTGSQEERTNLEGCGWRYEGIGWTAPVQSGKAVFRLYNPNAGDHHYTMSSEERDNLIEVGWNYEGVAWNSAENTQIPLYRLYNPNAEAGAHHYTPSEEERDNLIEAGWQYEGISWYGLSDETKAAIQGAEEAVEKLERAVEARQTDAETARKEADEAESRLKILKAEQEKNQKALKSAQAEVTAAEQEVRSSEENQKSAERAYEAALNQALQEEGYETLKAEAEQKEASLQAAKDSRDKAENSLKSAETAYEAAQSEKEAADKLVTEKTQAHDNTVTALNAANQKLAEAEATLASATTNLGEAEKAVETAKANVATAKSNLDQANNDLTEANKAKDVAKKRLSDAQAAIDSAQKAVEAAQAKINEGALGFYESMAESDPLGSQRAISMLNKAATTDKLADNLKTKIGAEGDATSLENVKKALDIIVVGNQMHVTDNNNPGLPDWRITNTSMAASQVHANAETDGAGHLMFTNYEADSAIGSVPEAEISAWGYGTDPYRGWYTEEKQVYDYKTQYYKEHGTWPTKEEIAKALGINVRWVQTGHYIIVTGKYEYVGLGYNTSKENYLRNTAVSNLDSNRAMDVIDGKEVYENSYTIDDYRALFDAYYNEVMSALTNAQNDLTAKQDALKALQATDGLTSEEKQAITDAQAAVEAAQEKYDALNTTLSEAVDAQSLAAHNELVAQIGVDKAVEAKTEAANAEADAQTALNDAKTAAEAETKRNQ